jgi:hypothetical protein
MAAFAQEVPGQKPAEDALTKIAEQGVLGAIVVLLAVALFFTIRALLKSKDDRFGDQKAMTEALTKVNEASKDLAIEMKEHAANQVIEFSKSQEATRNQLAAQEKSFGEMRTQLGGLQQEQARLVTSLASRKLG